MEKLKKILKQPSTFRGVVIVAAVIAAVFLDIETKTLVAGAAAITGAIEVIRDEEGEA